MTWIDTIEETDANEELKKIFNDINKKRGKVSNILKIHSLLPQTMKTHLDLYMSIMFNKSSIRRLDKELIAVIVSRLNNCKYCINHHKQALLHYWKNEDKINNFISSLDFSILEPRQKHIAEYAKLLTKTPEKSSKHKIEELKKIGLQDSEILEITLIISYFNFVNRIALGLGVTFTEDEMKGYKY